MNNYERDKLISCACLIQDKAKAIEWELRDVENPSTEYILEKIEPLIWDANVIKKYCNGLTEENYCFLPSPKHQRKGDYNER